LVEKNILLQSADTADEFVVLHNVRLMVFVSGRVPNFSKEQISDTLAYNWGRCAAILCNVLQVPNVVWTLLRRQIEKKRRFLFQLGTFTVRNFCDELFYIQLIAVFLSPKYEFISSRFNSNFLGKFLR